MGILFVDKHELEGCVTRLRGLEPGEYTPLAAAVALDAVVPTVLKLKGGVALADRLRSLVTGQDPHGAVALLRSASRRRAW